jgi:hypothetical protein
MRSSKSALNPTIVRDVKVVPELTAGEIRLLNHIKSHGFQVRFLLNGGTWVAILDDGNVTESLWPSSEALTLAVSGCISYVGKTSLEIRSRAVESYVYQISSEGEKLADLFFPE